MHPKPQTQQSWTLFDYDHMRPHSTVFKKYSYYPIKVLLLHQIFPQDTTRSFIFVCCVLFMKSNVVILGNICVSSLLIWNITGTTSYIHKKLFEICLESIINQSLINSSKPQLAKCKLCKIFEFQTKCGYGNIQYWMNAVFDKVLNNFIKHCPLYIVLYSITSMFALNEDVEFISNRQRDCKGMNNFDQIFSRHHRTVCSFWCCNFCTAILIAQSLELISKH